MNNKQVRILNFLSQKGNTAALKDIRKLEGLEHSQLLTHHLNKLTEKGLVEYDKRNKIVHRIVNRPEEEQAPTVENPFIKIPVYGSATAGPASIFNEDKITSYLQITKTLLNERAKSALKRLAAVQVDGESMNRAKIGGSPAENGDYVLVDTQDHALENGKYVVISVDGMPIIKKFSYKKGDPYAILISESTRHYQPILIADNDNAIVSGSALQVIPFTKEIV